MVMLGYMPGALVLYIVQICWIRNKVQKEGGDFVGNE